VPNWTRPRRTRAVASAVVNDGGALLAMKGGHSVDDFIAALPRTTSPRLFAAPVPLKVASDLAY
jgi:hypothetical protein